MSIYVRWVCHLTGTMGCQSIVGAVRIGWLS